MQTRVLIFGGGATGTGLLRDLALRGVDCCLVESRDLNAGTSGANHGLLHSGARYVSNDPESARECRQEAALLKQLAPDIIEDTGGLFVAVKGDDESYIADFPGHCEASGVPCREISPDEAREREPHLSTETIAAYEVEDASIDPFRLALENVSHAREHGAKFLRRTKVVAFTRDSGRIRSATLEDTRTGKRFEAEAEIFVNATGAWAGQVAGLAGLDVPLLYSKGTLVVSHNRVSHRVINRLRPPSDSDILVPGGTVSILGTTSIRLDSPDNILPTVREVDDIIEQESRMVPKLERTRYIRAYAGVRPLVQPRGKDGGDREVSRGFSLMDHAEDGLDNFLTITGGKLTTFRLMAEKTADSVCAKLGVNAPCRTREEPYPCCETWRWTEPGGLALEEITSVDPKDVVLCECEMIPKKAVDAILDDMAEDPRVGLKAISRRSRLGKGSCQGSFCALRTTAHLYDRGVLRERQGVENIRDFLAERWRGQRPILWDMPLVQNELQEALYCGLLNLDLED
ncbi:anaerobic glycerol-3-phosphate dehydrogenase subunit GlpA [Desulfohalovibrio reitneri]|uniref:anaerobic glycerol-3-phosphate dehydrogenase subunit GlpA n=1 Tax=Desulfohalovibrio reitneri TaxID=1307759 RepID=UPI0004A75E3B|nr:anaerobic glycerol-3-phosphate dehydrogenase subunit GlpA [Desulfohalovibrio reitneri]